MAGVVGMTPGATLHVCLPTNAMCKGDAAFCSLTLLRTSSITTWFGPSSGLWLHAIWSQFGELTARVLMYKL